MLSNIESMTAPVFSKIVKAPDNFLFDTSAKLTLAVFIATLGSRTQYSEQQFSDFMGWNDPDVVAREIGEFGEVIPSPKRENSINPAELVAMSTIYYPMLLDLEFALICNETSEEFVTSDHPVVRYNQLMEFDREGGSHSGWAWKGLQIFLPISHRICLFLYDASVYKVSGRTGSIVRTSRPMDIREMNTLQASSAQNAMYVRDNIECAVAALERSKNYRTDYTSTAARFRLNEDSELVRVSKSDIKTNLSLSFVSIRRKAMEWRSSIILARRRSVVYMRNPEFVEEHAEFTALVRAGRYAPGDFFKFKRDRNESRPRDD